MKDKHIDGFIGEASEVGKPDEDADARVEDGVHRRGEIRGEA